MFFKRKTLRIEVPTVRDTSQAKQDLIDAVAIFLEREIKVTCKCQMTEKKKMPFGLKVFDALRSRKVKAVLGESQTSR